MHVSRLYIVNYRSIRELDLRFEKGKNVIIGRNNCGKSNIIRALHIVLGETSPTYQKSENVALGDFHTWNEKQLDGTTVSRSANELLIWCELTREPDEKLDYDELYKCWGFSLAADQYRDPIRYRAANFPENCHQILDVTEDSVPKKLYVDPKLRNQATFEGCFEDKYCFAYAFRAIKDENDRVDKDIRFLFRETDKHDWFMAFKANVRNELLQSAIIPSFRDPHNQLRLSSWTWYGKLMQHLTAGHMKNADLRNALDSVRDVANQIFEHVRDEVRESALEIAFPGTQLYFQFNAENQLDLYKTCVLYVDDGFKSLLTDKGSGIQSAVIIGLFSYYTKYVNAVTSALLCIEEPELYLHPHARRLISDRLTDFIGERNQVIITTHSAEFLRTSGEDVNVIVVSKSADAYTTCTSVNLKDYARILVHEFSSELFFAEKVIVCEGYDDFVLRTVAKEIFPKQLDSQNISVISAAGKDNLSTLVQLVMKLGIKCHILADFDYLLRDKSEERRKYGDVKPHESVVSLPPDFFRQECVYGDQGEAIFKKLQRLRDKIRNNDPQGFYLAKKVDEVNVDGIDLRDILSKLRQRGLGILTGEIEDLCQDATVSSDNKMSLDAVFELNARIANGENISDIFDVTELIEVLGAILT
jgi:energy-coupling factor transporter ATP-binding protein EcfA2